jgi:hypothetical protein
MKKSIAITAIIIASQLIGHAQTIKKNSVYVELGGNGFIYSVNYDRIIPLSDQLKLAPRIGIEYLPQEHNQNYNKINIPLELNILWSKQKTSKNFLESGLGLNLFGIKKVIQ